MSYKIALLLAYVCVGVIKAGSVYPSIIWDPWNPLFACFEPKVNVRIGDSITFACPSDDFHFYVPKSVVPFTFENLYYLGTNKEHYKSCNATGMRRLLNCDASRPNPYKFLFREFKTSRDSLAFTKGSTHYLIGTGFRTEDNLSNLINGSCRYTDANGKYRLRLQIHICNDNDVDCKICQSRGCYYKGLKHIEDHCVNKVRLSVSSSSLNFLELFLLYDGCDLSCTNWMSNGSLFKDSSQLCSKLETRACVDAFIGMHNESRYIKVPCPSEERICGGWTSDGKSYFDSTLKKCYSLESRTCKDYFSGEPFNETRHANISCPETSTSCNNMSSNSVLAEKCMVLTTRYCTIAFRGKFKELYFSQVSCAIPSANTASQSPTIEDSKTQPTIRMSNANSLRITLSNFKVSESIDNGTNVESKAPNGSSVNSSICSYVSTRGSNLYKFATRRDNPSSDRLLITGLIVAVFLFFVFGICIGFIASKYCYKTQCSCFPITSNNNKVAPAEDLPNGGIVISRRSSSYI